MSDVKFEGWVGKDEKSVDGNMQWGEFEPKKWTEDDVEIEISHCGMCGSDLHTLRSGWDETPYPCVVGHEIIGKAVRVGKNVKHVKEGARVGVGAQSYSCQKDTCPDCSQGLQQHCRIERAGTYGGFFPKDQGKSMGGYAKRNRTNGNFVVNIPEGLDSADAAPMLCGGITMYSPLKFNGCGPGKTVGIVGVGGLGHFGILFAKALRADKVVGISRKADKRDDVLKLGADQYIATDDDKDWSEKNSQTLDLIISTVSSEKMPLNDYFKLLKTRGTFIQVGAPDGGKLPEINIFALISSGIKFGGSAIGSPANIEEMLNLAVEKKVKPWIQKRPMEEANQAVLDLAAGKPRYRYVLVN